MKKLLFHIGEYASTRPYLTKIQNYLKRIGLLTAIRAFLDKKHKKDEILTMQKFTKENEATIKKVSDMLFDEKSKRAYNGIIDFRCTGNVKSIKQIMLEKDLYFVKDIISLTDKEVFIDGGAYDGDITLEFVKRTGGKYKEIIAFEPSPENYIKLGNSLKNVSLKDVTIYEEGLWSEKTALSFFDDGSVAAHIGGLGREDYFEGGNPSATCEINVNSIDNAAFDKAPTFIKMDIEGAELEALKGAQKTIRQYRPKLAISLYHKKTDLVDIPLYIRELVPEYKLYVRHHSHYDNETVLYAVI